MRGSIVIRAISFFIPACFAVGEKGAGGVCFLADPDFAGSAVLAVDVSAEFVFAVETLGLIVAQGALGRFAGVCGRIVLAISALCLTVPSSEVMVMSLGWWEVVVEVGEGGLLEWVLGARGRDLVGGSTGTYTCACVCARGDIRECWVEVE